MIRAISYFVTYTLVRYTYYLDVYQRNKLEYFFIILKSINIYKNNFFLVSSLFTLSLGCRKYFFMIQAISYFVTYTLVRYAYYFDVYQRNKLEYFFIIFKFINIYKNNFFLISSLFTLSLGCRNMFS